MGFAENKKSVLHTESFPYKYLTGVGNEPRIYLIINDKVFYIKFDRQIFVYERDKDKQSLMLDTVMIKQIHVDLNSQ